MHDLKLICPKCGNLLKGEDSRYAVIYTCERCGLIIMDLKLKLNTAEDQALQRYGLRRRWAGVLGWALGKPYGRL